MLTGYLHADYAMSLREFGQPYQLPRSKGWILRRKIPGTNYFDAMGIYPYFCCQNWDKLKEDLDNLHDLISIIMIPDPFGDYTESYLKECFSDLAVPYKEHYVADFSKSMGEILSHHHRRDCRVSLRKVDIEIVENPVEHIDTWMNLHNNLVKKHNITGIKAFSRQSFAEQLQLPGTLFLIARHNNIPVGALIAIQYNDILNLHVVGYSAEGYKNLCIYALYYTAYDFSRNKVKWGNIGGVPGAQPDKVDHYKIFKQGWATETRMAYLCGRIFNKDIYDKLTIASGNTPGKTNYFPLYRTGQIK
ncbi:MAG: hypothetical protein JEZ07_03680 [Phycisphaerae bacterium]|nr:hypothetical protein [Phycisphaerae bacterium]